MSAYDLKKAVFLESNRADDLNSEYVKAAWLRSSGSRGTWPPEAILANTLPGSEEHYLRSRITAGNVLHRYEQKIASVVERDSFEAPFPAEAHRIVSYVKDDPRLNIPPDYIHDRFLAAKHNGQFGGRSGELREAVYLFQSTELSSAHRAIFTPEEIGELFQLCLKNANNDTADSIVEIYKTTRNTPKYRAAITPQMAKQGFQFCLDRATNPPPKKNPDFYAYQAILMLHHTIADDRLRSPQGISGRQIDSLIQHYKSVINKAQEEIDSGKSSVFSRPEITKELAIGHLEYIEVCTLPSPDRDLVGGLTSLFKNRVGNHKRFGVIPVNHACNYLDALKQYPVAEPN